MKKITLSLSAVILALCSQAQTFSASYPFDLVVNGASGTTDPTAVPTATGATFSSFTAVGTPANPNATGRFSFTDWTPGATASSDVYSTHTGTLNTAEYYEVTVTPTSPYTLSLSDITFRVQRSGSGIRTYAVRSSVDGYATNLPASINPANPALTAQFGDVFYWNTDATTSFQDGSTITLGGTSFTNLTSPVTFRFYGWNAEANTGTFSIDNVMISGTATAPAALAASFTADTVCFGDSTSFMDMSTGPNTITNWLWSFDDGTATSTLQNPSHLYSAPGAYEVSLTVIDNMLNSNTYTDSVWVHAKPVADFSAPSINCGATVQFYDSSTVANGTINQWMWMFGDPTTTVNDTSVLEDPTHTFSGIGTYTVTEIVSSTMGCTDTMFMMITNSMVNATLNANVVSDSVYFSGAASGGTGSYTYVIDYGDGSPLNTTPTAGHVYSVDSIYTACLFVTDSIGCSDTSCTTFTILSTGIAHNNTASLISIHPNPSADGIFTVTSGNATINVFNIVGKNIFTKKVSDGRHTIDLSSEANGSYFVTIQTDKELITKKITISK
jgi:PKD repeat protein